MRFETWQTEWVAVLAGGITAAACCALLFPLRAAAARLNLLDRPGPRSSHSQPTPRIGGVGLLAGVAISMAVVFQPAGPILTACGIAAAVAVVGLLDDLFNLPWQIRMLFHIAAAAAAVLLLGLIPNDLGLPFVKLALPTWLGAGLAVFFIVGFVNAFNFMDGINGLAGMQGLLGASAIGGLLLAAAGGNFGPGAIVCAAVAGGCAGFLPHNFPRAKTFLGDAGSTSLGFVLALLCVYAACRTNLPWACTILPLGAFIYDALFTMARRLVLRQPVYHAHRDHLYQLLIRSGGSHAAVCLIQVCLMLVWSAGAFLYFFGENRVRLIVLIGLPLVLMPAYSILVFRHFLRRRVAGLAK
ncbi:MAG: glycosyltransferase family 4 protein [Planctomycetes bacterium]|nr:glycosyltransferase family 4 protein [Planctomycetota bacterium]